MASLTVNTMQSGLFDLDQTAEILKTKDLEMGASVDRGWAGKLSLLT